MSAAQERPYFKTFKRLHIVFNRLNIPEFFLKPQQIICLDRLLHGKDVVAVLPMLPWDMGNH